MELKQLLKSELKLNGAIMFFLFSSLCITAQTVTGTVTTSDGPMVGASIIEKGTVNGAQSDFDGNFSIEITGENAILVISYVGYKTKEISVNGQKNISVVLEEDVADLDQVVVVAYGAQKKSNLTGAISIVGSETFEDRPVANVQQALQGASPGLQITTSNATGEPGAEMNINIRGLQNFGGTNNSQPLVLIDNIPMGINDIDPDNIESISVLKDVASSSIYGARAAYGVVLITTKNGKKGDGVKVSYSTNYAITTLLNQPENADALSFAHTMNHARANIGAGPYFDATELDWITQNMANPGSAPEILPTPPNGLTWNLGPDGLNAHAATDWESIYFKKTSSRKKHNLNISGGTKNTSYYLSAGYYDEEGQLKQADDYFTRYNLDGKISSKVTPWMDVSLLTKYRYQEQEYPAHPTLGRSFVMLLMTRLKPTKPAFYPGTEVWTGRIGEQELHKALTKQRQLILSPRIVLEPVKDWVTTLELNYRTNDDSEQTRFPTVQSAIPDGLGGSIITSSAQDRTRYWSELYTNTYMSPNIRTEYTKNIGKHNFHVLAGFQQETFDYNNLQVQSNYLLTDGIPSISTSVGDITTNFSVSNNDQFEKGHWSTQGFFGRVGYNFDEKYLLEFNIRRDGSSRFKDGDRWGTFPSFSAGWVLSKESFYPLKNQINFLKIRGSYGSVGNQDVANYLHIPNLPVNQSNYLFGGERLWGVGAPDLSSIDLTWETVTTLDLGIDLRALNNRLGITFDWYRSNTTDLETGGLAVSAVLGALPPRVNAGEIETKGWDIEVSWQNTNSESGFSYGFTGVLSDYKATIKKFPTNPTLLTTLNYAGRTIGEIWGLETDGLFQSADDVASWQNDQSDIYNGTWFPGDLRYVDQNGDNVISVGDNTLANPGDRKVIGNSTPRYQFGFSGNASYKGFDMSFFIQGIGKRDLSITGLGTFRGPANGPLHANVYTEHLDFWRDETSPLGANPNGYFPNAYSQFIGQNNKNYRFPTTRFLQNGAYLRLKNVQLGYTLPNSVTKKAKISKARIYVSGENLITITDLMIYDPEAFNGATGRIGDQYPLSQVFSLGLNVNF
ncbi:TonB-dependent receptor [Flavivirga aquimarina]|uniref:TonB-dependent receptor n=1 Tax=Flavivirga aquimarina TaxID=2027862 RepID=A0ABT8WBX2_9FLAO|nr:TonB-dependent receptor [Flavivirga aquimarina]MDO5970634.1 TonB-dependent receptor [Flavivirga aquimarina]